MVPILGREGKEMEDKFSGIDFMDHHVCILMGWFFVDVTRGV